MVATGREQFKPTLPPEDAVPATILAVPGTVIQEYAVADVLADAIEAVDPDLLIATPPNEAAVSGPHVAKLVDVPVIIPKRNATPTVEVIPEAEVGIIATNTPTDLPATPADLARDLPNARNLDGIDHGYLVTDRLELSIDPHHRRTRLEGIESYTTEVPTAWRTDAITHLSTRLRPDYTTVHRYTDGGDDTTERTLSIHGIGLTTGNLGAGVDESTQELAVAKVYRNGAVCTTSYDPTNFGLRGLDQVGQTRAERLRKRGYDTREAVSRAEVHEIADIRGLGQSTAETIQASATAVANGEVVPIGDGAVPDGDPIFIDIETNGLNGSTAWLIGVLDGDARTGTYLPFRQRTLWKPAEHLESFLTWLAGTAANRPVVAWNGYDFDFPIIARQLEEHHPDRLEEWRTRYRFDPLSWATQQDNATLPGRSNKLEAVATALGWEPQTGELDGQTAAELYNAWATQSTGAEARFTPDWKRFESYCEDDVRALATIYEALGEASRRPPGTATNRSTTETTSQGSLSDFS
ncbi:ribonuclease H-like domain-containing protein [Natronomonas sp. F2-12]|jgi:uncharacterized protein YprB with RNaseH-like and TPR domain|uniref:Ribonuclease H-like domain-containing protein n=1 Tax=Natronomonas aquatica TaxID=2841590 RepID=A0A9R1D7R7_9EURY|nr:ribonuclease H-like domain-containing protein [Natronomonas aquatica]MCQ4334255.1 ribonuclease H-like domain-containing protein [Natronomonas aquatica]